MSAAHLFDDAAMAAGYAHDRPPVHAQVMARLRACVPSAGPVGTAVDVGCGAGASTAALVPLTSRALGIDLFLPMVMAARHAVPEAGFAVAAAEAIPCASRSVHLLAAAGALDYVDLDAFVHEADRVLERDGLIAVWNYGLGRPTGATFPSDWPDRFTRRWPRPLSTPVDAASFAGTPFRVLVDDRFAVTLPMTRTAYLAYVMTDTAVAGAVEAGTGIEEIRAWCAAALLEFGAERPVAFDATLLVLTR